MVPTFTENFSKSVLDGRIWNTDLGPRQGVDAGTSIGRRSLWSNGEAQIYTDKNYLRLGVDPFELSNGMLTIKARSLSPPERQRLYRELAGHPEFTKGLKEPPRIEYSSGVITTRDRFEQRYGYFEIRAKWSTGKGVWPAFWLLPADGAWPPEIDILEAHGDKPGTTFQTLHVQNAPAAGVVDQSKASQQDFHVYGALWAPSHIDFYVDGMKTGSVRAPAELNRPMYILANLAIGGYWPGYPLNQSTFTADMTVDYIKVWQFQACSDPHKPCTVQ